MLTPDTVDIELTEMWYKNVEKFPHLEKFLEENNGDVPSFFFEEELFTLEEWGEYLKETAYERFGITLDLSPSNLSTFE